LAVPSSGRIHVEVEGLQQLLRLNVERAEASQQLLVAELDVLRRGHGRHQAGLLIDHADAGGERVAGAIEAGELAVDIVFAGGQPDRPGDRLAQGRFAGTVLAHQCMHFAGIEIEIDVFDGVDAAVDLAARDDAQHRHRRRGGCLRLDHEHAHTRTPGLSDA
jgi:hypothetical protein